MINLIEIPEESSEEIEHLSDKEKADSVCLIVLTSLLINPDLVRFGSQFDLRVNFYRFD